MQFEELRLGTRDIDYITSVMKNFELQRSNMFEKDEFKQKFNSKQQFKSNDKSSNNNSNFHKSKIIKSLVKT